MDLAAIHRLCNNYNYNEGIQNHLTAAVPGCTDQFLIIAFGLLWSQVPCESSWLSCMAAFTYKKLKMTSLSCLQVTASNLLTVDTEVYTSLYLKNPLLGA